MSQAGDAAGPVPKRSQERRRRNTHEGGNDLRVDRVDLQSFEGYVTEPPDPNPNWHPAALAIWNATLESGQRIYFEPSDWAILALLCSQISQLYRDDLIIDKVKLPIEAGSGGGEELIYGSKPMTGQELSALLKGFASLGLTEGDRRRIRIELERGERKGEERKVPVAEARKARLSLVKPLPDDGETA